MSAVDPNNSPVIVIPGGGGATLPDDPAAVLLDAGAPDTVVTLDPSGVGAARTYADVTGDGLAAWLSAEPGNPAALLAALGLPAIPSIPATNLVVDLNADDLSEADGAVVATWADNSFSFTAAGSARPTMYGASRGLGNRKALLFDGAANVMSLTDAGLDLSTLTMFVVVQAAYAIVSNRWVVTRLFDSAGGSPYSECGIYQPASGVAVRVNGTEYTAGFTNANAWGAAQVWCLSVGAAGSRVYVNGRLQLTGAATSITYDNAAAWCIGGRASATPGEWFKGLIARVVIYTGELSATARQQATGALATYYGGIPVVCEAP